MKSAKSIVETARRLSAEGYFGTRHGSGGNISVRLAKENRVAITPSGRPYREMKPEDICTIDFEQRQVSGPFRPSMETGMHLGIYRNRTDVNAVIHTHQHYASVLAVVDAPIPALFDEVTMHLGTHVALIPYGMSGSPELASHVADAVKNGCHAFLLQNHGALCLGRTLEAAVARVELLEKVAKVYLHALSTGRGITQIPTEAASLFDALGKEL